MACFLLALLLALFLLTSESYQKLTANKKFLFNHVGSITRNTFAYQFNLFGVNKRDKQFDKIFDQIDYKRSATEELPPIEQDPLYPVVKSVVLAGSSRKANGITALRVTHLTEVTRFMIVLEGNSKPQTQAIANAVEDSLEELPDFTETVRKQGDASGGWILLDYGSIMVHIMTPQMRNFYKLEKRWRDAQTVDVTPILGQEEVDRARKLAQDKLDMIAEYGEGSQTDEDEGGNEEGEEEDKSASIFRDEEDPFWK